MNADQPEDVARRDKKADSSQLRAEFEFEGLLDELEAPPILFTESETENVRTEIANALKLWRLANDLGIDDEELPYVFVWFLALRYEGIEDLSFMLVMESIKANVMVERKMLGMLLARKRSREDLKGK